MELFRSQILICGGTGCTSSGSARLVERFEELLEQNGLTKEIKLVHTGCFGLCEAGPVVIVYPEGAFYSRVKVEDVDEIVSEHLIKGRIVQRLLYHGSVAEDNTVKALDDVDFYRKQSAWRLETAASSTRRISTSISPSTATRRFTRCSTR